MARAFPADARMQHFFEEQYAKETEARLRFHEEQKTAHSAGLRPGRDNSNAAAKRALVSGLPQINPLEFALRKKREEAEALRQIVEEARRQQSTDEMRPVDAASRATLLDGFSREGRGRYRYLHDRHHVSPEVKYTFPMVSSWEYGWKIRDEMPGYGRPSNARTSTIKDSFYMRNGVPTLSSADAPHVSTRYIARSYTFG